MNRTKASTGRIAAWLLALAGLLASLVASASTITYYHNDLAGSPVVATNASGQVVWRESYRPYGERLTNSASAAGNSIWFTGRRQDAETGLVYMGARYYDPMAGRFVSTDPKGFDERNLQSFSRYAYGNNNPYRYIDPNGREPHDWVDYFRLLMNPYTAAFGEAGLDNGQFARAGAGVQADIDKAGSVAQTAALAAATLPAPEAAIAGRAAPYVLSAISYASRAEARSALVGEAGVAANQFFRGATSKAENFIIEMLSDGAKRLQYFSPAKSEGYGKLYVQEISPAGKILREYKDTVGPSGVLERKWVHGGSE